MVESFVCSYMTYTFSAWSTWKDSWVLGHTTRPSCSLAMPCNAWQFKTKQFKWKSKEGSFPGTFSALLTTSEEAKKQKTKQKQNRGCFPIVQKRYEPIQRTGVQMYKASPLNSLKLTNTTFWKCNLEHFVEIHTMYVSLACRCLFSQAQSARHRTGTYLAKREVRDISTDISQLLQSSRWRLKQSIWNKGS